MTCIRTQHKQPGTPTSRAAALWVAQGRVRHLCHDPVAEGRDGLVPELNVNFVFVSPLLFMFKRLNA